MEIFGELERALSELYPYRWAIAIVVALTVIAVAAFAYQRRLHVIIWRHRIAAALIGIPLLIAAIPVGVYTISPLFERTHLDEASPLVVMADSAVMQNGNMPSASPKPQSGEVGAAFAPRVVYQGEFHGADDFHFGRGQALIIESAEGRYVLRFENFSVRNGPDLIVYLSTEADDYSGDSLELGKLKATDGAFNYDIPEGTDISRYKSAVVWCKPFGVLFAVAPLEVAPSSGP
jgi:hypothetical protein